MGNRLRKVKRDIEGNNSGKYLFSPTNLTRTYHTDLISQLLRRLSCTFHMDNLFKNHKSVIGNTCDQIFTDVEGFVYVHAIRSNS